MLQRFIKIVFLIFLFFLLIFISYFFIGFSKPAENITLGVNFSQKHAQNLGLNWKETYLALLGDLKAKNLKIATYWDLIEPREGEYNFEDLDWQISEAEKKEAKIILVVGLKTPRWPECHEPEWVRNPAFAPLASGASAFGRRSRLRPTKSAGKQKLLDYIKEIVNRYKNSEAIFAWQVENEPFFPFGECPKLDKDLLKKEINLVKSLDSRPVIISESGEFPLWIRAAKYGDMVGVTMYKKVWFILPSFFSKNLGGYLSYPFPPIFYQRKALLINKIFGKKVICVELQAEPWGPILLYDLPLEEQEKTMNLERFQKNIEFAKKTGLDTFYLWGAEWWYWMKTTQNQPEIWNEAKKLFEK